MCVIQVQKKRLAALVDWFESYLKEEMFCLCGMMSAEMQSVSPAVKKHLKIYFDDVRIWIVNSLKRWEFGIIKVVRLILLAR